MPLFPPQPPRRRRTPEFTSSGDVSITGDGRGGLVARDGRPDPEWGRITAHVSANEYTAIRLDDGDSAYPDRDALTVQCWELTGRTDVAVDTLVRLEPNRTGPGFTFRLGAAEGTGGCAGCGWVAGLTDLDCLVASVVERLGRCECDPCDTTTTAARYPTAATSTAGTGALSEWSNVEGIFAAGEDEIAGAGLQPGEVSGALVATGFGFSIPTGATIKGIAVSVGRYDNMDPPRATDHTVKLVKAGTAIGTNKASGATWPNTLTEATYGGAADLWSTTWTPAEINASTFGVSFTAQLAGASGESALVVDWIRVTVTYEECETVNSGPLHLTTEGGEDWTAAAGSDPATVTICGVEYALTFSKEGCDGPCLTLTSGGGSGSAYTAVRDCCGPNYAIFSIGTTAVCTGTTDATAGPVGNTARIKVEWTCCPADGYEGPGYYCVRDAGTEDECAPVEVLSAADVCAGAIEICSGPYSTLAEAEGVCGPPATPAASCAAAGLSELGQRMVSSGAFDDYYRFAVAPGTYRVIVDSTTYLTIGVTVFGGSEQLLGFNQGNTSNVCLDFTVPEGVASICVRITNGIGNPDGTSQLRILSGACP